MKKLLSLSILVALLTTAHAAPVLVFNGDFANINGIQTYTYQSFAQSVPGFTVNSAAGNGFQAAANPSGLNSNLAFFHTLGGVPATLTTTTPVATIDAGFSYTISLVIASEAGIYSGAPDPGDVTLQFLAGTSLGSATLIKGTSVTATAGDLFGSAHPTGLRSQTYSVTLTAAEASAFLTDNLYFQVYSNASASTQDEFDNVQINVTSTPEPSTYALSIGGFLLLALYRFRQSRLS